MKKTLYSILCSTLLLACQKDTGPDVECPAYNSSFFETWFPYKEGKIYTLMNADSSTIQFSPATIHKTEAHTLHTPDNNLDNCFASGQLTTPNDKIAGTAINIKITQTLDLQFHGPDLIDMNIGPVDMTLSYHDHSETLESIKGEDLNYFDSITLGGKQYFKVYKQPYKKDNMTGIEPIMDSIYIAKGYGIIGIRYHKETSSYWLQ